MDNYTTEQWKPVVGYEGLYEVSDHGRVRSLDRVVRMKNGVHRRLQGGALAPHMERRGYASVKLSKDGVMRTLRVHNLVARAFIGPPTEGQIVCHCDSNPSNNRASNLRWDTAQGNMDDMVAAGRAPWGARSGQAVLTDEIVRAARDRWVPRRVTIPMLAEEYGVNASTLKNALSKGGHSWRWLD